MEHHDNHGTGSGPDIDRRLSKLEAVVESLASNVGRITDDIGALAGHLQQRGQTNWGTVFAGITLVVLLVTGYVGLPLNSLQNAFTEHKERQMSTDTRLLEHLETLRDRVRELEASEAADQERMHSIERDIFRGGAYKSGRPIPNQEN